MFLAALTTAVENAAEVTVAAPDSSSLDVVSILSTVGDIGSIGVAALAIILVLTAIRSNFFSRESIDKLKEKYVCNTVAKEEPTKEVLLELKPILQGLVMSVQKISGNDLSHLQEKVNNLGATVDWVEIKVEQLEDKIDDHDKQARDIKNMVTSTEENIKEIRKLLTRTAA